MYIQTERVGKHGTTYKRHKINSKDKHAFSMFTLHNINLYSYNCVETISNVRFTTYENNFTSIMCTL